MDAYERGFEKHEWSVLRGDVLIFALNMHKGQMYGNEPYFVHLVGVEELVKNMNGSPNARLAALLHDVIEDTSATFPDVLDVVDYEVANLVSKLTHYEDESYEEYMEAILASDDLDILQVKLADSLFNLNSDKSHMKAEKARRLNRRYAENIANLSHRIAEVKEMNHEE